MSTKLKTPLKTRLSVLAVASCLGGLPLVADAAGLGRITVFSALGQPLRAEIEVNASKEELPGMAARIASPESFRQAGLEYSGALTRIKVALDKRSTGQPVIRLSSDAPVSDPFIDMLLELNWPAGRLVREYTFLLDPPEVAREVATSAPVAVTPKVSEKVAEKPVEKAAEKPAEKLVEKPAEKAAEKPLTKAEKRAASARLAADQAAEKAAQKAAKLAEKAAEKAAAPAEKSLAQRLVKSGDSLAKIASEVKPEGVALEQMLVGLFRANPDAFSGKNMNRLKSGVILAVPAAEELSSVAVPEARKEVLAQAQDWNAYRRKLAGVTAQAPVADAPAQKDASGKITAKVEDKAAAPKDAKDQVKVSKTPAPGAQPPAAQKASAEEEKIAREKALKESAERAAQLEKNVADLQKLADIKNKQLAQAQAAAKPAEPVPAAKVEAPKPAVPAAPVVAEAPKAAPAAPAPIAPPPLVDAKPAEPPKPVDAPKPKPKAPPPPPPVEEDGSLLASPALWGGLAALLGGIGGLVFYRRRKAAQAGEVPVVSPSLAEPSLGANSVFRATGGQSVDTSAATPAVTDFSQTGPGTIDTDEVDPVAEAEVYMAYGRDAQAEEILLEALQKDGKRLAIHLKLLEIYSQRKSAKQFETLATELYAQTGGSGTEWEKAVVMGAKLDPANPLYSAGGNAPASPFAAPVVSEGFDPDATAVLSPAAAAVNPGQFGQVAVAASDAGVDFGLDLPVETGVEIDAGAADGKLSFDLNIGDLPSLGEAPEVAAFNASDTLIKGAPVDDALALDFDLDLGGTHVGLPAESPASATAPDIDLGGALDFDLKLGDSVIAPTLDVAPVNKPDLSSISLDLGPSDDNGMMDFEKTLLATPGMVDAMATNFLGSVAPSADGGAQEQAIATKLDLAKAYEEMGDSEGARELLNEVLAEGSESQKAAASAMLARLA